MGKCNQCGTEVSDGALFCKKCGTPIKKETNMCVDDFRELSFEMRNVCDKMIEMFVSEMKKFEIETTDTQKILEESNKEIENLKKQLTLMEVELERTKRERDSFGLELNLLREQQNVVQNSDDESEVVKQWTCHGCGEVITEDMVFCGNCGTRLK